MFGEEGLSLPGQMIPYEEMFYRKTDVVIVPAKKVELIDRCFPNAEVRLSQDLLKIGKIGFGLIWPLEPFRCVENTSMGCGDDLPTRQTPFSEKHEFGRPRSAWY